MTDARDAAAIPGPSPLAMIPFVSVADMLALVNKVGAETAMTDLAAAIEADFRRWPEFDKTPRVASHSRDGVIELMPAADATHYGFKYVNGHPSNNRTGHQTVTAFGVLSSVATGYPLLISEMTVLTALRTAATSAMAAKWLATPGAETMAMIGAGAQCEFQALAFRAICGIERVRLYDVDPAASVKAAGNLRAMGMEVEICKTGQQAVEGAQIITTCTADKRNATVLSDNMVGAGVHVNAIGGDCPGKTELAGAVLKRASIFVEYPEQTREEGEIQQLAPDHPVTELWHVITGQAQGRKDAREITIFDSVGFAIEDFSALRWLLTQVQAGAPHQMLDMMADPDDPRDLFGMVRRAQG